MMKLQEVCEVYSGYALKEFHDDEEGYPVIKIGNICSDGTLDLEKCQFTNDSVNEKYFSKKGDIYVALSGATTGKIGIITTDDKYIINQRVGIVRKNDEEIPDQYIKYFLMNKTEKILEDASGCAQPNISPKQIGQYEFPKGDYSEMRNISDILDRISNVIMQRKQELQKLDELIKARFVELFADFIERTKPVDFESICEFVTVGIANSATHAFCDDGVIMFRNQNIKEDYLDTSDIVHITPDFADKYKTKRLKKNDLLIVRTGYPGVACLVPEQFEGSQTFTTLIARIKSDASVNPRFVCHYINSEYGKKYVKDNSAGAAQQNFGATALSKLPICIPTIESQDEYIRFLEQVDKSKIVWLKAPNIINYTHEKLAPYMYKTYRRNAKWQILNF